MPCEDCEFPFYLGAIETADKKLINELLAYPSVVAEEVVEEIGLGINPMNIVIFYDNTESNLVIMNSEYISFKYKEEDYKVYKIESDYKIFEYYKKIYDEHTKNKLEINAYDIKNVNIEMPVEDAADYFEEIVEIDNKEVIERITTVILGAPKIETGEIGFTSTPINLILNYLDGKKNL